MLNFGKVILFRLGFFLLVRDMVFCIFVVEEGNKNELSRREEFKLIFWFYLVAF